MIEQLTINDPSNIVEKINKLDINFDLYFCQILYEDCETKPFINVEILKKCNYERDNNKVIFDDGHYIIVPRYLSNCFKICKYKSDLSFQIRYCGLFYNVEDVKQNVRLLHNQINTCIDKLKIE